MRLLRVLPVAALTAAGSRAQRVRRRRRRRLHSGPRPPVRPRAAAFGQRRRCRHHRRGSRCRRRGGRGAGGRRYPRARHDRHGRPGLRALPLRPGHGEAPDGHVRRRVRSEVAADHRRYPEGKLWLTGVDQSLVGMVQRADGTSQLTLGGWALYRYSGDAPGRRRARRSATHGSRPRLRARRRRRHR